MLNDSPSTRERERGRDKEGEKKRVCGVWAENENQSEMDTQVKMTVVCSFSEIFFSSRTDYSTRFYSKSPSPIIHFDLST